MGKDSGTIENARDLAPAKQLLLGFQHLFTMFGSSVLVPLTTGLDISVVLFMNGLGTLLFHFMTKKKVPVFLGSSYAYITPVITVAAMYAADGLAYARGGILIAGVVYMLMSLVVWKFGTDRVSKLFPPVITGSMILVIGLNLAPTAISMASEIPSHRHNFLNFSKCFRIPLQQQRQISEWPKRNDGTSPLVDCLCHKFHCFLLLYIPFHFWQKALSKPITPMGIQSIDIVPF